MTNIVLAPGILGFARIGSVPYFNGVAEHLDSRFRHLQAYEHVVRAGIL